MRAALLLLALGLAACPAKAKVEPAAPEVDEKGPEAPADPGRSEGKGHEELPQRVRLTDQVIAAAGLRMARVTSEQLPLTADVSGELIADPDRTARVVAVAPGRIMALHFREGERVKRGAVLAEIESPELARARAALTQAEARARNARLNSGRLERLAGKGLAAGQETSAAEAEAQVLDA